MEMNEFDPTKLLEEADRENLISGMKNCLSMINAMCEAGWERHEAIMYVAILHSALMRKPSEPSG